MKRQFILHDPDPTGTAGGTGDPEPKKKEPKPADPPTSADTGAGGKSAREVALEKKLSVLEDDQNTLKGQLKAATDWIAKEVEGKKNPASKESLADEVNSLLGWGLA